MDCGNNAMQDLTCSEYRPVVLIAQSNEEDLREIVEVCKKLNKFDVVTTSTGQGIIDKINETCFDAVVLGLKFSDITGATVAYLVHQFDPLASVAFLTVYSSDILIAGAQDLGFEFWNKEEKFKDLESFCEQIYNFSLSMPCKDVKRLSKREHSQSVRENYLRYGKLIIPDSIRQVVMERKERRN